MPKLTKFPKKLVETITKNGRPNVWINDKGEWLFHETKGFERYTRKEVVGGDIEEEITAKLAAKNKPNYSKMNLANLKALCAKREIPEAEYSELTESEIVTLLENKDAEATA